MALKLVYSGEGEVPVPGTFDFMEYIESDEVAATTQKTIAHLIKSPDDYELPDMHFPLHGIFSDKIPMAGMAYVSSAREGEPAAMVVHWGFAQYLTELPEFEGEARKAIHTSAVFIRALDVMYAALAATKKRNQAIMRGFPVSYIEKYWQHPCTLGEAMPYRAAGLIALHSAGVSDVDVSEKPPYPRHISGLMNPIAEVGGGDNGDKNGFNVFSSMLLTHSKLSAQSITD